MGAGSIVVRLRLPHGSNELKLIAGKSTSPKSLKGSSPQSEAIAGQAQLASDYTDCERA